MLRNQGLELWREEVAGSTEPILYRTHSIQNTFYTEHIPHRTHSIQNTFYTEHILYRTHSTHIALEQPELDRGLLFTTYSLPLTLYYALCTAYSVLRTLNNALEQQELDRGLGAPDDGQHHDLEEALVQVSRRQREDMDGVVCLSLCKRTHSVVREHILQ